MILSNLLLWAKTTLKAASTTSGLDAEVLLCFILDCSRAYLIAHSDYFLEESLVNRYKALIKKRATGYPLEYITGKKEFWSLEFIVTPEVLIPRPDTETLVEAVLQYCDRAKPLSILDLGTGSGAIACSLAHECSRWQITGLDLSETALGIAKQNINHLKLQNVVLLQSNWGQQLQQKFDVIVSNPPYLKSDDEYGDRYLKFEPTSALVSGPTGLECIQEIAQQSIKLLNPNGRLFLEHGFNQAQTVREILTKNHFKDIKTLKDLAGHYRVTICCLSN